MRIIAAINSSLRSTHIEKWLKWQRGGSEGAWYIKLLEKHLMKAQRCSHLASKRRLPTNISQGVLSLMPPGTTSLASRQCFNVCRSGTFHKVLIFQNLSDSNLKFIRQMNENEQDKCIFEDHFRFITSLSVAINAIKINSS